MKPIIGEFNYPEMSQEEISRFMREAEVLRSEAVRNMFRAIFRGVASAAQRTAHGFRSVAANPGIHPSAGTR